MSAAMACEPSFDAIETRLIIYQSSYSQVPLLSGMSSNPAWYSCRRGLCASTASDKGEFQPRSSQSTSLPADCSSQPTCTRPMTISKHLRVHYTAPHQRVQRSNEKMCIFQIYIFEAQSDQISSPGQQERTTHKSTHVSISYCATISGSRHRP